MRELLMCHCVPLDGPDGDHWGIMNEKCSEVKTMADADPAIIEALNWLQARGLATVDRDSDGDFVRLLPQPTPATMESNEEAPR